MHHHSLQCWGCVSSCCILIKKKWCCWNFCTPQTMPECSESPRSCCILSCATSSVFFFKQIWLHLWATIICAPNALFGMAITTYRILRHLSFGIFLWLSKWLWIKHSSGFPHMHESHNAVMVCVCSSFCESTTWWLKAEIYGLSVLAHDMKKDT